MKKLAVITISDSRYANGKLEDLSGDRIIKILSKKNFSLHERILVSDERSEISLIIIPLAAGFLDSLSSKLVPTIPMCGKVKVII